MLPHSKFPYFLKSAKSTQLNILEKNLFLALLIPFPKQSFPEIPYMLAPTTGQDPVTLHLKTSRDLSIPGTLTYYVGATGIPIYLETNFVSKDSIERCMGFLIHASVWPSAMVIALKLSSCISTYKHLLSAEQDIVLTGPWLDITSQIQQQHQQHWWLVGRDWVRCGLSAMVSSQRILTDLQIKEVLSSLWQYPWGLLICWLASQEYWSLPVCTGQLQVPLKVLSIHAPSFGYQASTKALIERVSPRGHALVT